MPTKIEWATETWNLITGCTPISEGCQHCYAQRMAKRLAGRYGYAKNEPFAVTLHPDKYNEPIHWKKPRRVFVCSMGDLFHEDVSSRTIALIFGRMHSIKHHTYMILTKRPQRMKEFLEWFTGPEWRGAWPREYPHVWLGVTAENQQRADERIPVLLQIPAAKRFVSVEPMLGPVRFKTEREMHEEAAGMGLENMFFSFNDINPDGIGLDWVICGGETGPGARPMHPDWVRSLRDQCQVAEVPFYFKQWGEWRQCDYEGNDYGAHYIDAQCIDGELWDLDKCNSDGTLYTCGDNLMCPQCKGKGYIRVGKKNAGRLLDGQEWQQMPGGVTTC